MFVVEKAYTAGLAQCEAAFAQWRSRVGNGKLVGKFGSRVQVLLDEVERRYSSSTQGSATVRLKAARLQQLVELVDAAVQGLFRQQLVILQTDLTSNYRNLLTRLVVAQNIATNSDAAEDVINPEEAQQAMRQVLFEYRNKAVELEIESLGITSQAGQAEYVLILLMLFELCLTWLSLYLSMRAMFIISHIEWCIRAPMSVFFYRIIQYTISQAYNITNILISTNTTT